MPLAYDRIGLVEQRVREGNLASRPLIPKAPTAIVLEHFICPSCLPPDGGRQASTQFLLDIFWVSATRDVCRDDSHRISRAEIERRAVITERELNDCSATGEGRRCNNFHGYSLSLREALVAPPAC